LDHIRLKGENPELVNEVIALSKRYGIVTPYTSYLVTEDNVVATPLPTASPQTSPGPVFRDRVRPGVLDLEQNGPSDLAPVMGKSESSMAPASSRGSMLQKRKTADQRYQRYSEKKHQVMSSESGAEAIDFAQTVKEMKSAKGDSPTDDDAAGIRYLAGHTFRFQGGGWVDVNFKPGMQTLKIKYMGQAYFQLIQKSSRLKSLFSLGGQLTIVVSKDRALVISPDGKDEVSEIELKRFIP
jgi:Ca-activated chloride channel family protein